jgi:hypothetical protein
VQCSAVATLTDSAVQHNADSDVHTAADFTATANPTAVHIGYTVIKCI